MGRGAKGVTQINHDAMRIGDIEMACTECGGLVVDWWWTDDCEAARQQGMWPAPWGEERRSQCIRALFRRSISMYSSTCVLPDCVTTQPRCCCCGRVSRGKLTMLNGKIRSATAQGCFQIGTGSNGQLASGDRGPFTGNNKGPAHASPGPGPRVSCNGTCILPPPPPSLSA